jgi:NTE family protein
VSEADGAKRQKAVNLALQGGGAHGAYTWGVLDALLEDGRIEIEAISGASAGAMNAVALAEGFVDGGADGARKKLHEFWLSVSEEGALTPIQRKTFDAYFGAFAFSASPAFYWFDALTHYLSPYEFNPLNINPLRDHLVKMINFEKLQSLDRPKLLVAATNVFTGKGAIFRGRELTADHVMASACLPRLFRAVEIKGVPYWDGGYAGNPPLWPLFYETRTDDAIIVQINPIERHETPRTARDIVNRADEITFNNPLLAEMRAVNFVNELIDEGKLRRGEYRRVLLHRIGGDGKLETFGAATKFDTSWPFLKQLRDLGRESAKEWLERHFGDIGVRGTLDLPAEIAATPPTAEPPSPAASAIAEAGAN